MKQIIEGKSYNTETAAKLHYDYSRLGKGDFRYYDETLYQTNKGRFFLAGEGGAMTQWARPVGDMTGGSSGIKALSEAEALAWAEAHDMDPDKIEELFSIEEA